MWTEETGFNPGSIWLRVYVHWGYYLIHQAYQPLTLLGFVVLNHGVPADPKNVEAVHAFSAPTDLNCLRSLLGLASCYRRFTPNLPR